MADIFDFPFDTVKCKDGTTDVANGIVAPCINAGGTITDDEPVSGFLLCPDGTFTQANKPCPKTTITPLEKDFMEKNSKTWVIVASVGLIALGIYLFKRKK